MDRCSEGDIKNAVCLYYFAGEIQVKKAGSDPLPNLLQRELLQKSMGVCLYFLFFFKAKNQTQVALVSSKEEALAKAPRMPVPPSACMTIYLQCSKFPKTPFL